MDRHWEVQGRILAGRVPSWHMLCFLFNTDYYIHSFIFRFTSRYTFESMFQYHTIIAII